jgi:uncharacterized protein (DUF924 family)
MTTGPGVAGGEVHAQAVLDFWFREVPPARHFAGDDALDRAIAARFGPIRHAVLVSRADGWRDDADAILAAIILLDQFSRNIHRGKDEAFAGDRLALALTRLAMAMGWDASLAPERRAFLYMPLMHAEDKRSQELSLACFEKLGDPENLQAAQERAEVIARFGRFPSRNAALRRRSTPEEQAWLTRPGAGW